MCFRHLGILSFPELVLITSSWNWISILRDEKFPQSCLPLTNKCPSKWVINGLWIIWIYQGVKLYYFELKYINVFISLCKNSSTIDKLIATFLVWSLRRVYFLGRDGNPVIHKDYFCHIFAIISLSSPRLLAHIPTLGFFKISASAIHFS